MLKKLQNKDQGFTIIEVMIVLVIAAVILLIVFLAVPALQRNSRNTQYNNEASAVSAAASEWVSNNNNGNVPSAAAEITAFNTAIPKLANTKNLTPTGTTTVGKITTTTSGVTVVFKAVCPTTASGTADVTPTAGTGRQIAVVYGVEASGGSVVGKCIDSGV